MTTDPIDLEALRGHTPGPWKASVDGFPCVEADGVRDLALCNAASLPRAEREANVRLITASPAMLAELTTRRARDAEVAALVAEHTKWAESFGAACVCALQGDFHPIEKLARCMPIHFPDGAPMLRSDPLAPFTGAKP
jgi:hypothetical protein